jgi:hypothetical protein
MSFTSRAGMRHTLTSFPDFPYLTASCQPALISPASPEPWRQRAISWKCIAGSLEMRKLASNCNAWTSASSASPLNSIDSPQPRNEERLAGQLANFYGAGNGLTLVRQAGRRPRLVFFRQIALEWTSSAATSAGSAAGTEATSSCSSWSSEPPRRPPVARPGPTTKAEPAPSTGAATPQRTNLRARKSVAHYRRRTGAT